MELKKPLAVHALGDEVQKIGDILVDGSDSAVALIASSFLDECLRSLLMTSFRPGETAESLLRSGRGVLGTYAARMELAYALRLIDKEALKALRTIGEIRNAFAHSYTEGTFEHPVVAPLCCQLDYAYEIFVVRGHAGRDPDAVRGDLDRFYEINRHRFTHTCVTLGQTLIFTARSAQEGKKSVGA